MLQIRALRDTDLDAVLALWRECGLLRPWNDPLDDIARARDGAASAVFVGEWRGRVLASVMCGSDGHRGWLYYLAVDPSERGRGHGHAMVRHAENWLQGIGVPKVELMIREDNAAVRGFYARLGYQVEPRVVMSRWLRDGR